MRPGSERDTIGLSPDKVEHIWGISALATGLGSDGFGAALWPVEHGVVERPACASTHVISVWTSGSTVSELYLDGNLRFRRIRRRGTFQLARAGEDVRVILSETSGTCLDLYVPKKLLDSAASDDFAFGCSSVELLPLKLETDGVITRIADAVASEILNPGTATRLAMDSAVMQLGVTLIRNWSTLGKNVRAGGSGLNPAQVRKTLSYLQDTLHLDISLESLAGRLGLSTFHFAREFKIAVGMPPHRYQMQLRLAKGRELIQNTRMSVAEVAKAVGYRDPGFFSRAFRREFGLAPGAFRRSYLASDHEAGS